MPLPRPDNPIRWDDLLACEHVSAGARLQHDSDLIVVAISWALADIQMMDPPSTTLSALTIYTTRYALMRLREHPATTPGTVQMLDQALALPARRSTLVRVFLTQLARRYPHQRLELHG